ncbi:glyoxalase superfamily protein [Devosia sp. SL43]|uniref:glyoxalase superfamily protein n=1 Tax=Devosia sp. SL43 TaxID=2806348 RepID=UPI001F1D4A51|nr:glyoxalase superfamily protein [Devosia sp. SL43]UJW85941.1 hypothetical protein IM737_01210 [Devosia sp. SL43]
MDSKLMAKLLRQALAEREIDVSHSDCLELVARQFGVANWNILSARIEASVLALAPMPMPEGWVNGSVRSDGFFRMGLDPDHPGCAVIESTPIADHTTESQFGTMSQSISAEPYRGASIRVACQLSSEHLDGAGTMWLRIDSQRVTALRFSNLLEMKDVPLTGTRDWADYTITMDVPDESASVHYGFLLQGRGLLRARNFSVERVETVAAPPDRQAYRHEKPTNLGFSAN